MSDGESGRSRTCPGALASSTHGHGVETHDSSSRRCSSSHASQRASRDESPIVFESGSRDAPGRFVRRSRARSHASDARGGLRARDSSPAPFRAAGLRDRRRRLGPRAAKCARERGCSLGVTSAFARKQKFSRHPLGISQSSTRVQREWTSAEFDRRFESETWPDGLKVLRFWLESSFASCEFRPAGRRHPRTEFLRDPSSELLFSQRGSGGNSEGRYATGAG